MNEYLDIPRLNNQGGEMHGMPGTSTLSWLPGSLGCKNECVQEREL